MSFRIVYRAGDFIRNTVKRVLGQNDDIPYTSKRLALEDRESSQFNNFMKIFNDPLVKSLLEFDQCNILADNYLIAIAYIYLNRAEIPLSPHDVHYLLSALYLAHEVQEDIIALRKKLVLWYPGNCYEMKNVGLHFFKNKIWCRMDFKCHVTKRNCLELMKRNPEWKIWQRKREESHSGAFRFYQFQKTKCKRCCKSYQYNVVAFDSNNNKESDCDDDYTNSDWEIDTVSEEDL